jgi:hypothetical protein
MDNITDIQLHKFTNLTQLTLKYIKIINTNDIPNININLDLYKINNITNYGLENLINIRGLSIVDKVNLLDDILLNLTNLTYLNIGKNSNLRHQLLI